MSNLRRVISAPSKNVTSPNAAFPPLSFAVWPLLTVLVSGAGGCSSSSPKDATGKATQGSGGAVMTKGGASSVTSALPTIAGGALASNGGALQGKGGASSGMGGAGQGTGGTPPSSANIGSTTGGAPETKGRSAQGNAGARSTIGGASGGNGETRTATSGASGSHGGAAETSVAPVIGVAGAAGAPAVPVDSIGYDVKVDPYGTSPLVAVINLRQLEASKIQRLEVTVKGQDGGQDFVKAYSPTDTDLVVNQDSSDLTFSEAGYHVPVLGLYPDRENLVHIVVDRLDASRIDLAVKITPSLSKPDEAAWVPKIQVKTATPELMEPGWTLAEISIEPNPNPAIVFVDWTRTIAFDERGAIRWALRLNLPKGETFTLRRAINGNLWSGSYDQLVEVNKLGRIIRTVKLSDYTLNHEILQIGSNDNGEGVPGSAKNDSLGNLLVLASKNGSSTIQDQVLQVSPDTGKLVIAWDLAQVFDPKRRTYIDAEKWDISENGDWLHDNGLAYSQADDSIIVSGRHQGIAKMRRDGTLVWLLAPHKGWNAPYSAKLLTAVSPSLAPYADAVQLGNQAAGTASTPEFDWPFGQHSPVLLPNGDLLLFDNGASRHFTGYCGSFSRAVIYRVDEAAMTVRQIGQHILSKSESACYVSNTLRLPVTGNIFIQPGFTNSNVAFAKEVTTQVATDGTLTFDKVAFDATVSLVADTKRWYVYSYRGHRWAF